MQSGCGAWSGHSTPSVGKLWSPMPCMCQFSTAHPCPVCMMCVYVIDLFTYKYPSTPMPCLCQFSTAYKYLSCTCTSWLFRPAHMYDMYSYLYGIYTHTHTHTHTHTWIHMLAIVPSIDVHGMKAECVLLLQNVFSYCRMCSLVPSIDVHGMKVCTDICA